MSAVIEVLGVANRRNDGGRGLRADAFELGDALACRVLSEHRLDASVKALADAEAGEDGNGWAALVPSLYRPRKVRR